MKFLPKVLHLIDNLPCPGGAEGVYYKKGDTPPVTATPCQPPLGGGQGKNGGVFMIHYNGNNIKNAKKLRSEMTPWERKLWYCFLNKYPVRFQRQKCIGQYIADFYCFRAKLVIELDGGGHYTPEQEAYDRKRTSCMEELELHTIRFCNTDVDKNFYGVCTVIDEEVRKRV